MRGTLLVCCALALAAGLSGAQRKGGPRAAKGEKRMTLKVTSPSFADGEFMPARHACGGADASPELSWTGAPAGTRSFAVIMDDPDAPPGTWVHWLVFDVPAGLSGLPGGLPRGAALPDGSRQGLVWGVADADCSRHGYYGPCPPPGKAHRYSFRVYALDAVLGLPAGTAKGALLKAMKGHVLAQGELTGLYKR